MFFLLRTAFWIGLVILLLPIDTGANETGDSGISPFQALMAAQSTVSDLSGFCERNPATCETGEKALVSLGAKARESARLVYEYLDEKVETSDISTDTLTASDRAVEWRAPEIGPQATTTVDTAAPPAGVDATSVALPTPKPLKRPA